MGKKLFVVKDNLILDGENIVRMENNYLQVDIAPGVGGRITSIFEKSAGRQFLWHNSNLKLERVHPGSKYDPNFYGGIDELLPNDVPEHINGFDSPDHGEIWTTPFDYSIHDSTLTLSGTLPLIDLLYVRDVTLRPDSSHLDITYRIENHGINRKYFLWKIHAALVIEAGDTIVCPAKTAQVADPQWSRWKYHDPFDWPFIERNRADIIPEKGEHFDYFYLYELTDGQAGLQKPNTGLEFTLFFDTNVFPYVHYFASYGGLDGHYTAILEPSTTMPYSVNDAQKRSQCSILDPGELLETSMVLYAGPVKN